MINPLFDTKALGQTAWGKVQKISQEFDGFLSKLEEIAGKDGREMALVRTKLEEACFFAKKSLAMKSENQEG